MATAKKATTSKAKPAAPKEPAATPDTAPVEGIPPAATPAESREEAATPNTTERGAMTAQPPTSPDGAGGAETVGKVETMKGDPGEGVQVAGQGLAPVLQAKTRLRVAARHNGFRRCGRAWPATGETVAKADYTDDQVATLLSDPDLVVTEVDAPE